MLPLNWEKYFYTIINRYW